MQRELYDELSEFDRSQGDAASALSGRSAILERSPDWLPALRHLEHAYSAQSREDELEPIAATLARVASGARRRRRTRDSPRASGSRPDTGRSDASSPSSPYRAIRTASGRFARSPRTRAPRTSPREPSTLYQRLQELVVHPLDKATLDLRAAEAAARLGRLEDAKRLLESSLEHAPDHFVALTTLAEVLEGLRDYPAAARAVEAVAEASAVDAHKVATWHQAAALWLDRVGDKERGRAALERMLALDPSHEDAIVRLQNLLIEQGDHPALAALLERRIDLATDAEERVALEVQRGKLARRRRRDSGGRARRSPPRSTRTPITPARSKRSPTFARPKATGPPPSRPGFASPGTCRIRSARRRSIESSASSTT